MSVASFNAANPNALLSLVQPGNGKPGAGGVSDPLAALFAAFTGSSSGTPAAKPSAPPGSGTTGSPLSSSTLSALIALQGQGASGRDPLSALIGQFDTDGDGQISKSEFETGIGSGANASKVDALFGKIDGNGDGTISDDELASAIRRAQGQRPQHVQGGGGGGGLSDLLSSTDATGATTQTTTNSDGSTTTTTTYPDGTVITSTTPAAQSGETPAGGAPHNANGSFNNQMGQFLKMLTQVAGTAATLALI